MNNLELNSFSSDFGDFKIISILSDYENHWILGLTSIIIEKENLYYFIQDDKDKINDISKMPLYIKQDWLNYNKHDLTLDIINKHIKYYKNDDEDMFILLMAIRRDFILTKYIK
jgi:hypothetical protein